MKSLSHLFLLTVSLVVSVFAQDERSTAPVVWERYQIADQKISFLFPKLPTVISESTSCTELDRRSYYAYADEVVYEVMLVAKSKRKNFDGCLSVERFSTDMSQRRLSEVRFMDGTEVPPVIEEKTSHKVYKFTRGVGQRWLYDDPANSRWIEMSLHRNNDKKSDVGRFLDSVDLSSTDGKDIGEGASQTLGDSVVNQPVAANTDPEKPAAWSRFGNGTGSGNGTGTGTGTGIGTGSGTGTGPGTGNGNGSPSNLPVNTIATTSPLTIIAKPRARYTDEARKANAQGAVMLKVTLLANGSVGTIVVVTSLGYGLTEQAVAAARRLVFLPKQINGYSVSVIKPFEYHFSVY